MSTLRNAVDERDHATGPNDAPVTVVEYGDYECPFCGAAHPAVKQLQAKFAGRLRFVFRNFPLVKTHENAMGAACVAEFAGEHDRFWEVHDALFVQQTHLGRPLYSTIAEQFGLNAEALWETLDSQRLEQRVRADFTGGLRSGVNRTPTFFINGTRFDAADYRYLARDLGQAIVEAEAKIQVAT